MIHRFATPSGLGFSGVGLGVWAYRVYIYIYIYTHRVCRAFWVYRVYRVWGVRFRAAVGNEL